MKGQRSLGKGRPGLGCKAKHAERGGALFQVMISAGRAEEPAVLAECIVCGDARSETSYVRD
jgi:hypothetical protein